jgi:hypothetical protein
VDRGVPAVIVVLPRVKAVLRTGTIGDLVPQRIPLTIQRGDTLTIPFEVVDEADEQVDCTGCAVVGSFGPNGGPDDVSHQADWEDIPGGLGSVTFSNSETNIGTAAHHWDLEFIAANGDTAKIVLQSPFEVDGGIYRPGQSVDVLPSQAPLAIGPVGPPGPQGNPGPAANWQATGTSSGATPLNLDIPYTIPIDRAALVRVFVVARRASDGLAATWEMHGTLKRGAGAAVIGGAGVFRVEDEDPDDALIGASGCVWSVSVTLNGSALRVVFTGDTGAVAVKALAIAMENL